MVVSFPASEQNGLKDEARAVGRLQIRCRKKNFFARTCCSKNKKDDKREPGLIKEEFNAPKYYVWVVKPIDVTIVKVKSIGLAEKV